MGGPLLQTLHMRIGGSYTLVKLTVSVCLYAGFIPYNRLPMPKIGKKSTGRGRGTPRRPHSTASRPCPSSSTVVSTTPRPCPPRRAAAGGTTSPSHLNTTTTQSDGTLSTLNLSMDQLVNVIRAEIDRSHTANADGDAADQQASVGNQCPSSSAPVQTIDVSSQGDVDPLLSCFRCSYHCS